MPSKVTENEWNRVRTFWMLTFHSWFLLTFHSPLPLLVQPTSYQTWMNVEAGLFLSPRAHQCTDQEKTRLYYAPVMQSFLLHKGEESVTTTKSTSAVSQHNLGHWGVRIMHLRQFFSIICNKLLFSSHTSVYEIKKNHQNMNFHSTAILDTYEWVLPVFATRWLQCEKGDCI